VNSKHKTNVYGPRPQRGVSLVELMVALVIGFLLLLGLVQIFGATRATYQTQEGLSRVQENGRFATQFMQRQLRMVGFMGCGSDSGRALQDTFVNHLAMFADGSVPGGELFRFQRPIEAFTEGEMDRPAELAGDAIVAGTDVLILRIFGDESLPVMSVQKSADNLQLTLSLPATAATSPIVQAGEDTAIYAVQNCASADVFAATFTAGSLIVPGLGAPNVYADSTVTNCGNAGGCPWDHRISNVNLNSRPMYGASQLNAELHRAEYFALFIRNNPVGIPSLYVRRFERTGTALGAAEELVEGVDNLQLRFGFDSSPTPNGVIDEMRTAEEVVDGFADAVAIDNQWQRVLSVRIGMLLRSPAPAAVSTTDGAGDARTFDLLGVTITPPTDGSIRQIYETTIALRNRIFNS